MKNYHHLGDNVHQYNECTYVPSMGVLMDWGLHYQKVLKNVFAVFVFWFFFVFVVVGFFLFLFFCFCLSSCDCYVLSRNYAR